MRPLRRGRLAATVNAGLPRRMSSTKPARLPRAPTSTKTRRPSVVHGLDRLTKSDGLRPLHDGELANRARISRALSVAMRRNRSARFAG